MGLYEYLAAVVESDESRLVLEAETERIEAELIDFIDEFWEFDH